MCEAVERERVRRSRRGARSARCRAEAAEVGAASEHHQSRAAASKEDTGGREEGIKWASRKGVR
eukprot:81407-Pleurochrysis_carterae.AAC.3